MTAADSAKLPDTEVREFAESPDRAGRLSVMIELGGHDPIVTLRPGPRPGPLGDPGLEIARIAEVPGQAQAMDRLNAELSELGLARTLTRLDASFVVSVSPEQLRAIARLPEVGVIRPNRTHQVPADTARRGRRRPA